MKFSLSVLLLYSLLQVQNDASVSAFTTSSLRVRSFLSHSGLKAGSDDMASLLKEYSASVVEPSAAKIISSVPKPEVDSVTEIATAAQNAATEAISAAETATAAASAFVAPVAKAPVTTKASVAATSAALGNIIPSVPPVEPGSTPSLVQFISDKKNMDAVAASTSNVMKDVIDTAKGSIDMVAGPVEPGKAPTLAQFLSDKKNYDSLVKGSSEAMKVAKTNFDVAQQSIREVVKDSKMEMKPVDLSGIKSVDLSGIKSVNLSSIKSMTAGAAASAVDFDFNGFIQKLNLEENGAWYLSGILLLAAIQQRNAGSTIAKKTYEKELDIVKAKANEAAEAAAVAAAGAKAAKELAAKLPQAESAPTKDILESSRYSQLKLEKEMMKVEMERLIQETALLKQQIKIMTKESSPVATVEVPKAVKQVMQRDPDEDKRILQILKDMDNANSTTKKTTKKRTVSKKKKTVKKTVPKAEAKNVFKKGTASRKVKKSVPKKEVVEETLEVISKVEPVIDQETENPWASLSESTLKRKTVSQLTEYLEERKAKYTDDSGKILKKAELVSVLRAL